MTSRTERLLPCAMQVLWSRKRDFSILGGLVLVIGIADLVIFATVGSRMTTALRVNTGLIGVIATGLGIGLLRSRVFISDTQIRVRNLWRDHTFAWADVTGIVAAPRQVTLVTADGTSVVCMALSPRMSRPGAQAAVDAVKAHIEPA